MKHRLLRVNELVKRELSAIIARDIVFENALVTVSHVNVTRDLKNAHVYISILGSEKPAAILEKLEARRTALQTTLARHVVLKYTPHLVFHQDDSIERGVRVIEILQKIEMPVSDQE
jgi:ribosome-binding factor A